MNNIGIAFSAIVALIGGLYIVLQLYAYPLPEGKKLEIRVHTNEKMVNNMDMRQRSIADKVGKIHGILVDQLRDKNHD
jgi:hypothetical protein|tara:strand:+ start:778 stop:1011 length:234 start_codon:yes stop_codon:yes gene_type:complete